MPWVRRRVGEPVLHTGWELLPDGTHRSIEWMEAPLRTVWEEPAITLTVKHFQELAMIRDEVEEAAVRPEDWKGSTDPFLKDYPCVNEFLTCPVYASGKSRECCQLKITFGIDNCQVQLQDNANDRGMSTTAPSVKEALKLMEGHIARSGAPAWRVYGFAKGKKKS